MMDNEHTDLQKLSNLIEQTAKTMPYPTTPDIAAQVRRRLNKPARRPVARLAWAAALLIAIGLLLAVPQVRATVIDMLRAGAVTLLIDEAPPNVSGLSSLEETLFADSQNLTFSEAQERVTFDLLAPPELGNPDAIYIPQIAGIDGQIVALLWRDDAAPDGVQLLLYQIDAPFFGIKEASISSVRSTYIDGREAFWIEDQHSLTVGREQIPNLVARDVLVWSQGDLTLRLESSLNFEETLQLAESLQPLAE